MHLTRYRAQLDSPADDDLPRSKKKIEKKNAIDFDMEKYAFDIWKVNSMAIPGMNAISLLQLIGEVWILFQTHTVPLWVLSGDSGNGPQNRKDILYDDQGTYRIWGQCKNQVVKM